MKLFIMTDLEGASGVVGNKDTLDPRTGRKFSEAVANLTHDVNAAIEGALAGGAEEITVLDGDGRRFTLLRDQLNPRANLLQGVRQGELAGFVGGYDAMFAIGVHAMAGTPKGVLNHTFSSVIIHNLWLNGRLCGELGFWAAWAGVEGVPTVLVAGDRSATEEARAFIPGVETVAVKEGLSRYYALCYPAAQVAEMLRQGAKHALQRRAEIPIFRPGQPFELRIEFTDSHLAGHVATRPGVTAVDGRTVQATGNSLGALMSLLWP